MPGMKKICVKYLVEIFIIIKFAYYQTIMIMCNMNDYICSLIRYLENLLGEKVIVKVLDESTVACLPIYITSAYKLYALQLLGKDLILLCNTGEMQFAPAQIRKQKELVESKTGKTSVFAFETVASYNLQRLIIQRMNYIIPGKQLFIPDMLLDLRPLKGTQANNDTIPAIAQCMVLYHLQVRSLAGKNAREIAELFGVSYPNANRAFRWLKDKEFITLTGDKTKSVSFNHEHEALWEAIKPHLVNPIERTVFTDATLDDVQISGISALSGYTLINDETRKTYAVSKERFKELAVATDKEFGTNCIEIWKYNPGYLSENGLVDRLSLYLTLKDNEDERIQIELESMIDNMKWYTE